MNHAGRDRRAGRHGAPACGAGHRRSRRSISNISTISRRSRDAKAEIFSGLVKGGVAIVNRDIDTFPLLESGGQGLARGLCPELRRNIAADAHLVEIRSGRQLLARLRAGAGPGRAFQPRRAGPPHGDQRARRAARRARGRARLRLHRRLARRSRPARRDAARAKRSGSIRADSARQCLLIDESYNANPASMRAAIDLLGAATISAQGRRIAVLGDMLELGPSGPALHAALNDDLQRNRIDLVFAAGPLSRHLFDALPPEKRGAWAETAAALEPLVAEALRAGDVVMVKGSNGSELHVARRRTEKPLPRPRDAEDRRSEHADLARGTVASFRSAERLSLHHVPRRRRERDRACSSSSSSGRRSSPRCG